MTKQKNWLIQLSKAGISEPARELRYIMNALYVNSVADEDMINTIVARRCNREPLAKILGYKDFWNDRFFTNVHTLDPRPDSETLIEVCLNLTSPSSILELGVGTGCLILSLLKEWQQACGFGVDISYEALHVAKKNAHALGVNDRIQFMESDWFTNIPPQKFDLIISNPPYIAHDEIISEETRFDPQIALYATDEGLAAYKIILKNASQFLKPEGFLVLEIGPSWINNLETDLTYVNTHKDLAGHNRVVVFQKC